MSPAAATALRCRDIRPEDAAGLVRLLRRGFPARTDAYWARAIDRLFARAAELLVPAGAVLESGGDLVGVLLLVPGGEAAQPRANLSSWFVDPRFSAYGPLLANRAIRHKDLTYLNVSPAPHTWQTIEAQGFRRCSQGRLLALPALMAPRRGVRVHACDAAALSALPLPPAERDLLIRHVGFGCLAVVAEAQGALHPFLFLPWRIKHWLPAAQLVYCRDIGDFSQVGGAVGRFLLRRGMPAVLVDACGPVDGLPGRRIADRSPKYVKGPGQPRTGDLTDTELVMFGP